MTRIGLKAADTITGLKGVITAKAEFLHGQPRYELSPEKLHEGTLVKPVWLDEPRLKFGKRSLKFDAFTPVIELGAETQDPLTKMEGVVTARFVFINGCVRVEVQPKALKDGRPVEAEVFDEGRLAPTSKPATKRPGGPRPGPTPYSRP
jgi:hypothetical protein